MNVNGPLRSGKFLRGEPRGYGPHGRLSEPPLGVMFGGRESANFQSQGPPSRSNVLAFDELF